MHCISTGEQKNPKQEFSKRESSNMEVSVPDMNIHCFVVVVLFLKKNRRLAIQSFKGYL